MTKHTKRIKQTDLDANAPQADNFSWSESQTGTAVAQQGTDGDEAERTLTMLDHMGSPVVTATGSTERATRATRPEI